MMYMIILFLILFSASSLVLLVLYFVYRKAFYSPNGNQNDIYNIPTEVQYKPYRQTMKTLITDLSDRSFEDVWITSCDGLKLYGRYYHYHDGAPLDIAFHGYRGTAIRDMCGGIRLSYKTGHNILLVDQRAHGKSEGHTITFGIKERYDCLSWVEYAEKRFGADVRIFLYGVSMGAASVLMASELVQNHNVYGILADSPYSSPKEIIKKVCKDMKYPPNITYPVVAISAKIFGGVNLSSITAEDAVQNSTIPIIILHGEDDRFVPHKMSEPIAGCRPNVERYTFPDAAHGISGIVHMESYNEVVLRFITRHCPSAENSDRSQRY